MHELNGVFDHVVIYLLLQIGISWCEHENVNEKKYKSQYVEYQEYIRATTKHDHEDFQR